MLFTIGPHKHRRNYDINLYSLRLCSFALKSTRERIFMSNPRFEKYAWGVLGYNLLVILWGAYVRDSGSGAGCGSHWPLCNGQVIPLSPRIETLVEFTHRLSSGLSLVVIAGLVVW